MPRSAERCFDFVSYDDWYLTHPLGVDIIVKRDSVNGTRQRQVEICNNNNKKTKKKEN